MASLVFASENLFVAKRGSPLLHHDSCEILQTLGLYALFVQRECGTRLRLACLGNVAYRFFFYRKRQKLGFTRSLRTIPQGCATYEGVWQHIIIAPNVARLHVERDPSKRLDKAELSG